ncbi:uncharacterized protein [Cherax quadricarinatus]|uniref:uncharacterized protein n=1 Tax=Cherax quadricarinatus TaxID=27406 RepID=UPI00387EA1B0
MQKIIEAKKLSTSKKTIPQAPPTMSQTSFPALPGSSGTPQVSTNGSNVWNSAPLGAPQSNPHLQHTQTQQQGSVSSMSQVSTAGDMMRAQLMYMMAKDIAGGDIQLCSQVLNDLLMANGITPITIPENVKAIMTQPSHNKKYVPYSTSKNKPKSSLAQGSHTLHTQVVNSSQPDKSTPEHNNAPEIGAYSPAIEADPVEQELSQDNSPCLPNFPLEPPQSPINSHEPLLPVTGNIIPPFSDDDSNDSNESVNITTSSEDDGIFNTQAPTQKFPPPLDESSRNSVDTTHDTTCRRSDRSTRAKCKK